MKKQTIISFLAAMLLASCSSEDSADLTQLSAPVPLTLNVEVGGGVSTRTDNATTEKGTSTNIDGSNDKGTITIYAYENGTSKGSYTYTVDSDGKVTSDSPYYYEDVKDVDFYATAEYRTFDNKDNCKDYLYATAKGKVTENGGIITLKFDHKASKLKFELTRGDGVTNDEFKNIASTSFSLTGLVKADKFENGSITTGTEAASITDCSKSYIVAPQKQENKVQASITMNDIEYKTSEFTMDLAAGSSYTCKITVSKTGINITSHEVKTWGEGEGNGDAKSSIYTYGSIPYASSDVKQYALAFTDGSFENLLEGTATVPDTAKISKLNTLQLNNVCGIVYSTTDPTLSDDVLAVDYPNCTHGLIVSLANAESETYNMSKTYKDRIKLWSNSETSIEYIREYQNEIKGQGYKFTKYLKSYNKTCSEDDIVRPVYVITEEYKDREKYPAGSSGWFLPSAYELVLLLGSKAKCYSNLENILDRLNTNLGNSESSVSVTTKFDISSSGNYWSSSEKAYDFPGSGTNYDGWAFNMKVNEDEISGTQKNKTNSYHVRAVCAF